MKLRLLSTTVIMAVGIGVTGCSSIADSMIENAFGSDRERRRKAYESKGIDRKRAERMAFEDEVWGSSPTTIY